MSPELSTGNALYSYNQDGNLVIDYQVTGTTSRYIIYLYLDNDLIGQYERKKTVESTGDGDGDTNTVTVLKTLTYLHTNHLGTPTTGMDINGNKVWQWDSEAFGGTLANEDPDGDGVDTTVNLRFPGQYFDVETGLHYNWHRYYDPVTGRYITSDPIGLQGGLNTYGYVGGNPLNSSDPFGLFEVISGFDGKGLSFSEFYNAKKAYMQTPAGQRETRLHNLGRFLQDKINKCDKNKGSLQEKFDNWVVSVGPNIDNPLKRHRTAAGTRYSSQTTQFNFWFFNSNRKSLTFFHEFRHLMDANNAFYLQGSNYIGGRLSGNATMHPGEIDAENWASSFMGGDCGC